MRALLCLLLFSVATAHAQDAAARPLPSVAELRAKAVSGFAKSAAARERYICTEKIRNDELDSKGNVKKQDVVEREIFYVNGYQIAQQVSKDGKPLSAGDLRKRDDAVAKAIHSASAHQQPKSSGLTINAGDILRLARLTNERRILVAGRPTIVFDVTPDPSAKPKDIEQKLVAAMEGTVSIDEAAGNLQDVNTRGVRDVKVGGGLVADVRKGFALHILVAPEADGVWLLRLAEGTGSARFGMFVNKGMRFRQETEGCKLFDVGTDQSTSKNGQKIGEQPKDPAPK